MHRTPRPLLADAYTIGSYDWESKEAKENSIYYLTFRKPCTAVFNNDNRIVFAGLNRILKKLFSEPITHEEIDESIRFLKNRKFTNNGLRDFDFPEQMWRRVVDEFGGYPPLLITGFPEGSVVYPNEPVIRVYSQVDGMGPLAAWFESTIMKVWATTERLTQARHWLKYNQDMIRGIEPDLSDEQVNFLASTMMHDFGDRSGSTIEESEEIAYMHLYCFAGTDTFSAAYQAWKDGSEPGTGGSVDALAHRIVQGFVKEGDCYETIYNNCQPGDIVSMVADCYDYYNAVENYLLPLAKRSVDEGTNITVVARPDSNDPLEQIVWTLDLAVKHGLYEVMSNGYKRMTTLRIIEGDGMTFETMQLINKCLINRGFAPYRCLIYGVGGFLRNNISRDNLSTKYALCSVGHNLREVVKKSEVEGKQTLPNCLVSREEVDIKSGITLYPLTEYNITDAHTIYYDSGEMIYKEDFETIKNRVLKQFDQMPTRAGFISSILEKQRQCILQPYLKD